jgi:hypothetical protein
MKKNVQSCVQNGKRLHIIHTQSHVTEGHHSGVCSLVTFWNENLAQMMSEILLLSIAKKLSWHWLVSGLLNAHWSCLKVVETRGKALVPAMEVALPPRGRHLN